MDASLFLSLGKLRNAAMVVFFKLLYFCCIHVVFRLVRICKYTKFFDFSIWKCKFRYRNCISECKKLWRGVRTGAGADMR